MYDIKTKILCPSRAKAQRAELSAFVDFSGNAGIDTVSTFSTIWCASKDVARLGQFLQYQRYIENYQGIVHLSKIRGQTAHYRVAKNWLKGLYQSLYFNVRIQSLWVNGNFDANHFSHSGKAANWLVARSIIHSLGQARKKYDELSLSIHVDGEKAKHGPVADMIDYLKREVRIACGRRSHLPQLNRLNVIPVQKSTVELVRERRFLQDLTALADLDAGAKSVALSRRSARMGFNEVRKEFGGLIARFELAERKKRDVGRFAVTKKFDPDRRSGSKFHEDFIFPIVLHE